MITYSKDSRTIRPGEYYVAIRGERYDGHDFILEAISKGAAGLVVEHDLSGVSIPSNVHIQHVEDSCCYLAEEANSRIAEFNPEIISITGSIGKTTTKNAIATVLAQEFPIIKSEGNLNTPLGISLTILNHLSSPRQKLVVEMSASRPGEIAYLCKIAKPSVAVVTNVKPVHLESMGSVENIARAKCEIVQALTSEGIACLNFDDPLVRPMAKHCKGHISFFGMDSVADINPNCISVDIPLLGSQATYIALAAFSVASHFGISTDRINNGIKHLKTEKGRLAKLPGVNGSILIDDSYNASPSAVYSALYVLGDMPASARIAFLGDMLELGSIEHNEHMEVVKKASKVADQLILVGHRMGEAYRLLETTGTISCECILFDNSVAALNAVQSGLLPEPQRREVVLVKGSAAMRMEVISRRLLSHDMNPEEVLVRQGASWKTV